MERSAALIAKKSLGQTAAYHYYRFKADREPYTC